MRRAKMLPHELNGDGRCLMTAEGEIVTVMGDGMVVGA
jgi:hypothetical protein